MRGLGLAFSISVSKMGLKADRLEGQQNFERLFPKCGTTSFSMEEDITEGGGRGLRGCSWKRGGNYGYGHGYEMRRGIKGLRLEMGRGLWERMWV